MRFRLMPLTLAVLALLPFAAAAADFAVTHDDPTGDQTGASGEGDISGGDGTRATTALDGEDVVMRIETAGDMPENLAFDIDVFYTEGPVIAGPHLSIFGEVRDPSTVEGRVSGTDSPTPFDVSMETEPRLITLRFPVSAIPGEASCFDFAATLVMPVEGGNAQDRIGRDIFNPGPCESSTAGNEDGADGGSSDTPGAALPLALLAVGGAALAVARRR